MTVPSGLGVWARWRARLPWLILGFALVLRVGYAGMQGLSRPTDLGSDETEYDTYAWNLAQGHGYRGMSPDVADQNHLTAYRSPGPSLIYAAVYLVVGHRLAAIRLLNCLVGACCVLTIIAVGRRSVGEGPAIAAAAAWAVWPVGIYLSGSLLSDQLATLALLGLVLCALVFAEKPTPGWALLAGVMLGTNLLLHPSRLFLVPMLGIWTLVQFRDSWRALALSILIPVVAAVMIVPWIVRNEHVFGRFIPFSTMGGSVLLQGNNRIVATDPEYLGYNVWDTAIPEYTDALKAPNDEFKRDSVAKVLATDWIKSHRDRWLPMAIAKIRRGWTPFLQSHSPRAQRLAMLFSWGPVLLAMLIGFVPLLLGFLRSRKPGWLLHMVVLHMVALDVVFFGLARYRYVVEPYCLLLAAGTVAWLLSHRPRIPGTGTPNPA